MNNRSNITMIGGNSRFKKLIRFSFWCTVPVVILFVAGTVFLNWYLPRLIRSRIEHLVVDGSNGLYTCSISNISVNFWGGIVNIEDIHISIDSLKYIEQRKQGRLPAITYTLDLHSATVSGLQIFPLILYKKIRIETIKVSGAKILLCRQHKEKNKTHPTEESLWRIIRPDINGIYVNKILLDKTKLFYRHSVDDKDIDFAYQDCSVRLHHIRIDSIGASNASRVLFTEDIAIRVTGLNYITPDSLYNLKMDSLTYSSFSGKMHLKNFIVRPTLDPIIFTRQHQMQVDIFESEIEQLDANNFKIEKIFTDNEFCLDTIAMNNSTIKIHRDRLAPSDTTNRLGSYPSEALASAPFIIRIKKVLLENANLHYIERQKRTFKTGDVFFSRLAGSISNITNAEEDIEKDHYCRIKLVGFFLHHGKMNAAFDFDLASSIHSYTASCDLQGPIKAEELNLAMIPFANVSFRSLNIHEGHIDLSGNKYGVTGNARFIYDHLKIDVLNIAPGEIQKQPLMSLLANMFAVRAHNYIGKNEVTAKHIVVERKRRQPFGNIMWELLLECMKKVMLKVPAKNIKPEM